MEYSLRCKTMGLPQLQDRRRRGDMITRFKIERGFEEVNWYVKPAVGTHMGRTSYHRELVKANCHRHNFFNNRTASSWSKINSALTLRNSGPTTVNKFKAFLDASTHTVATDSQ